MPDELIHVTDRFKVPAGEAMTIHRLPGKGRIIIDNIEVDFLEEGDLILMPLERWAATLQRAVAKEQDAVERVSRQTRRSMARRIARDARN